MAANLAGSHQPSSRLVRAQASFTAPKAWTSSRMDTPAGDGKILHRPQGMDAPERVGRHLAAAQQVGLLAERHGRLGIGD